MTLLHKTRKTSLGDLAILGGPRAFTDCLHVGTPNIGDRSQFLRRLNDILDRRWFTNNGPYVQEFESRVAEIIGVSNCIATSSGTAALELLIRAIGLTGEVLIPSFTFVATAHALEWQQITPIFCEIDERTHSIDIRQLEHMISPRTTGIIGVHTWGETCDIEGLEQLAHRAGLKLIFDGSHAFGCSHKGRYVGTFGLAEVFSFHATKVINTFEGGIISTADDDLAATLRLMRNFGFAGYDSVTHLGINAKMNEVSAAMGLTCLESATDIINTNRRNYLCYREQLAEVPGLAILTIAADERRNYQYVVIEIDENVTGISRDMLLQALHAEGVLVRKYFSPGCHRMEPYRSRLPQSSVRLPKTEALCDRIMVLPNGQVLSEEQVCTVCELIQLIIKNGPLISTRIAAMPKIESR